MYLSLSLLLSYYIPIGLAHSSYTSPLFFIFSNLKFVLSKFCSKRDRRKYVFLQNSLYLAISSTFTYSVLYSFINVTLLLFYLNRLKRILMHHNFNLIYNLYINFKFIKFLITIYIIIYKIFSKISQSLIFQCLARITDNKLYASFLKMA